MQIIAFINMKGGVGKTTLAVNVAYGLAKVYRKNVLIVDCDPQFNATQYLMEDEAYLKHVNDNNKGTLRDIFVPRRPGQVNTVQGTSRAINKSKMDLSLCTCSIFKGGPGKGKLDLIPSTLALMELDTSRRQTESKLNNYLREKAVNYDYVLIDCPPTISVFTHAAVLASDKYIVPIKPDPLSVIGLPLLERTLEDYCEDAGIDTTSPVGLVFTLVRGPTPTKMQEVMDELREERGGEVFSTYLSQATDVAKSVEEHRPIFLYKPRSKTAGQVLDITKEFLERTSGD
ncbi:MAG: ParA family protein [Planctomycetes bacterium]|nr:ParA family protein [Planctomycetota bacterium]